MAKEWIVISGDQKVVFDMASGILPREVSIKNYAGEYEKILDGSQCALSIQKCGGAFSKAVILEEPEYLESADRKQLIFPKIGFRSDDGKIQEELFGQVEYDFRPDGVMFSNFTVIVASDKSEYYQDLKLALSPDMSGYDDVRWGFLHRRDKVDGAMIQDQAPKRYLERGLKIDSPEAASVINFNGFRTGRESLYVEFFLEGGATLDGKTGGDRTTVTWNNGSPKLEWNFQSYPAMKPQVAMQLRNSWGWVIKFPPKVRHLPPYQMYHYLDNYQRYPTDAEMAAIADSGADLLILHENWRNDLQNNGIPFDRKRFLEIIALAHKYDLRVAVYIRGNEDSAIVTGCEWFDRYLRHNIDGLYMDYGSPVSNYSAPDENFPHGQAHFRRYYRLFENLRKRVGRDGLIFSHTGPSYAGCGMNLTDGYISGEGERGILVKSRKHHEYFSMAAVSTGTMWTAAFPEYSTSAMVPYLAATGQYPHNPLGEQFASSSLAHPGEPGINDQVFRPLWKLWKMVKNERDLHLCTDYNSAGVFPVDECGHHLMFSADGKRALYVLANFAAATKTFDVTPDWAKSGFDPAGKKCWLLAPQPDAPGVETLWNDAKLSVTLEPDAVAAFYFSPEEPDFTAFRKPYHVPCASGVKFLEELARQKELRENPPLSGKIFIKCKITPQAVFGYEDSMLLDLLNNDGWLVKFNDDGSFEKLAKFVRADGEHLFHGDESLPIELSALLTPGRHKIGVYTTHLDDPFYSFYSAEIFNDKGESYELIFRNALEPDRAFLHFDINID